MTEYHPVFHSPIAATTPAIPDSPDLRLSDLTGVQVTFIQGEVADILQRHFPDIPCKPGDLTSVHEGLLARLTSTEFYVFGQDPSAKLPSAPELNDSFVRAKRFGHATDYSHTKVVLKLCGVRAAEVLSKICGLNLDDTIFPNMQAQQTSAAKIGALIARCDEDGTRVYFLHVNRPFGQYFWEIVRDAGWKFGKKETDGIS